MKLQLIAATFATVVAAQGAFADSYCNVRMDRFRRGAVGTCVFDEKHDTGRRGRGPLLRVEAQGDRGERTVLFYQRLRVTNYSSLSDYPHFWDGNRNGDGTIEGRIRINLPYWNSRRLRIVAYYDRESDVLFDERIRW